MALLSTATLGDSGLVPPQAQSQQQQIRSQTEQVKQEIGTIIAEYQNNGLGASEDVAVLKAIQNALDGLSREQMERVLTLLAAARQEPDTAVARRTVFAAIQEQNDITLRLQQQLLQSQRQQDFSAIALRFHQLADRQHANLRMLRRYAHLAEGATVFNLTLAQKEYLQTQVTEQEMIADEVRQQLERLSELARDTDPGTAQRLAAMQQAAAEDRLIDRLQAAGDALTISQMGLAAVEERAIRDTLRRMVQSGAPASDSFQSLRSAGERLARMVQQEQGIVTFAGDMAKTTDASADSSQQTEERQADIVDDADELAQDLASFDPEVARLVRSALLHMQHARAALLEKAPGQVLAQAVQARADLQAALARVSQIMARFEKLAAAQRLPDKVAALKECITALRFEQEQLAARTSQPPAGVPGNDLSLSQAALARNTRELLPFADQAPLIPSLLSEAASAMDRAAVELNESDNRSKAQSDELAAVATLKKAETLLDARADQLAEAQKDLNDFELARERLTWAIVQQEHLAVEAAQTDALHQNPTTQPAATSLPARELGIRTTAGDVQHLLAARVPPADAALDLAQAHLSTAVQSLGIPDVHAALAPARSALADLDAARKALDPRINDLKKLLELPDDQTTALADLAQSLDQITQELQQPPDPTRQALVALRDQQRQIAAELGDAAAQAPPRKPAASAAAEAGDRIDRNQLLDAARQAQTVLDLLKPTPDKPLPPAIADMAAREDAINQAVSRMIAAADQAAQAASQTAPASAPGQPLDALPVSAQQAAQLAGDSTYAQVMDRGSMPPAISQSLSTAEQALAEASVQAAAGDQAAAKASRARALQALGQAQGAVASAQQKPGQLASQSPPQPGPPDPNGTPNPNGPNQPTPGLATTTAPGPGQTDTGDPQDNPKPPGIASPAPRAQATVGFAHLPPRDRSAIEQSRRDQYPQDYAPMIENYFKNLSEQKE